jgi:thiosulfate/3-mercaptopyruvate sulfurtransferase
MIKGVKMSRTEHEQKKWRRWIGLTILVLGFGLIFMIIDRKAQAVPNGAYAHPEVIIQSEELKILMDKKDPNIRIIDVREKLKYLAGHVPGSVHVWRPDLVDRNHPIPGMMAPKDQIESLMGGLGISNKNTIIIYSDGPDNGRLWWILAYYGFPIHQMKLLDGGMDGWKVKGYLTEMASPETERMTFHFLKEAKERKPLLCTLPEVKSALKGSDKVVLDVRSKKEFLGEELKEGAIKPGRIPGVIWIEWTEALVAEGLYKGYWKSAEEIKRTFSAKKVTPEKDIFMY